MSRLRLTLDLAAPGHHTGDLLLPWSDNANPLGRYAVPVITIADGAGPTVLVLGGVHGDEYEGPAAIMRLARDLRAEDVAGRLILMPTANGPAFGASLRCSPLDGGNLNRAFPGDADGTPTAMIADWLQRHLIPQCDTVIDLHSGGKASVFVPCSLPQTGISPELDEANMALARAMGLGVIWRLGSYNDNRSVNAACARAGVACVAAELGGGGGVDPDHADLAEDALRRALHHIGLLRAAPPLPEGANERIVEIADPADHLLAPAAGLFDRRCRAGDMVQAGDLAGWLHFPEEPGRAALELRFAQGGMVLAHTARGRVSRAEMLAMVVRAAG